MKYPASIFPLSDTIHLAGITLFCVSPPKLQLDGHVDPEASHTPFSTTGQKAWYSDGNELPDLIWKFLSQNT